MVAVVVLVLPRLGRTEPQDHHLHIADLLLRILVVEVLVTEELASAPEAAAVAGLAHQAALTMLWPVRPIQVVAAVVALHHRHLELQESPAVPAS